LARPDFRSQAAERLATERTEHTPVLIDLLSPDEPGTVTEVHRIDIERISANPSQPRRSFDPDALQDLAASIREHGILQPVLVRPRADGHFEIIAGERRWRAARLAGLREIPAIVEPFDDEAALEIAIIENLQREDISPLEEADMFERMTSQHGYSLRKLAQKLGKDKGYIENRLRLADAPPEVRDLVARRSDTLSAAYELMKVPDPRRRRRLAEQVATGELSLARLRQRIDASLATSAVSAGATDAVPSTEAGEGLRLEGLAPAGAPATIDELAPATVEGPWAAEGSGAAHGSGAAQALAADETPLLLDAPVLAGAPLVPDAPELAGSVDAGAAIAVEPEVVSIPVQPEGPAVDGTSESIEIIDVDEAARRVSHAVDDLVTALVNGAALAEASSADRQLFTKYLTINKIKLENAIAVVRVGASREAAARHEPPG
jgi:ParB/RepB/Spo0J family partition protein